MLIWVDLTNSPHVAFFRPFIDMWGSEGHDVVITTRDLSNTIELVEREGWDHVLVGGHAGKSPFLKIWFFIVRIFKLWYILRRKKIDVGISHSSFCAPLVGRLIGCKTIYLNDNEHAGGNYVSFPFADRSLLPECLECINWPSFLYKVTRFEFYPGVKEGVYLSQVNLPSRRADFTSPGASIFVRLEPDKAQYYRAGSTDFLRELLIELATQYRVVLLPRDECQRQRFSDAACSNIEIPRRALALNDIVSQCDLFIGAGGSMTRELAFLGVATLSVYQGELLEVDKFLVSNGAMRHNLRPEYAEVVSMLSDSFSGRGGDLYDRGLSAFNQINECVKELGAQRSDGTRNE